MANAIKKISVQRGYDVSDAFSRGGLGRPSPRASRYVLSTFGGAGGQHACAVADALGMTSVLIHPLAGVLAAYGIGLADVIAMREKAVEAPLTPDLVAALPASVLGELERAARAELTAQGVPPEAVRLARRAHLRYEGTDTPLPVPFGPAAEMTGAFEAAYRRSFSFLMPDKQVVVEAVSVEASSPQEPVDAPAATTLRSDETEEAQPAEYVRMFAAGEWVRVPLYRRNALRAGQRLDGPAVIAEDLATTVVEPGWRASVTGALDLLLTRVAPRPGAADAGTEADPVLLEVFSNLFMSVAEQMGVRLQSTAHSVNIKERLDFSCAIFDADGGLIANAPHIPVHLGSMGESIKMVIARNKNHMRPGDVYVLNDPYHGGTHLPDITVVTPVFALSGHRHLVLRGVPRPPRGNRGRVARVDAGVQHARRAGGRADRQLAARRGRPAARTGDHRPAGQRRISLARPADQPRRPARADRGQREGHRGAAPHGGTFRARCRARVHAPCPAERGRGGPRGDHRAQRR